MIPDSFRADARKRAAAWAAALLRHGFLVLDTETTGLNDDDELVQVAAMDSTGEVLINTLVQPTKAIDPKAQAVHGLSHADIADAPVFTALYVQLTLALAGKTVIAYNADFDRRMVTQTCRRYGLPMIRAGSWDCAMKGYAPFGGAWDARHNGFRWHSLTAACVQQQIPVVAAHSALGDCRLTLELIYRMAAAAE